MVSAVSTENAGSVFFTFANRAGVIKQGTKFSDGNRQVGAKDGFTEKIEKARPAVILRNRFRRCAPACAKNIHELWKTRPKL